MQTFDMTKVSSVQTDVVEEEYDDPHPFGWYDTWEDYSRALDEYQEQEMDHFDPEFPWK